MHSTGTSAFVHLAAGFIRLPDRHHPGIMTYVMALAFAIATATPTEPSASESKLRIVLGLFRCGETFITVPLGPMPDVTSGDRTRLIRKSDVSGVERDDLNSVKIWVYPEAAPCIEPMAWHFVIPSDYYPDVVDCLD